MTNTTEYTRWLEASQVRRAFYDKHDGNWTREVNTEFNRLCAICDELYLEWQIVATGKTRQELEAGWQKVMHSARD